MKRLGVIGTMVWDTIYRRGARSDRVEEWGGIGYALVALDAALPPAWEMVPLIKVGRDLAPRAGGFLSDLTRHAPTARFVEVPEPNNRVTLHYEWSARRTECLTGGVPAWSWSELGPMVRDLDALYLNFISGFELTLETAQHLRRGYAGPIYADLHSLFLGVAEGGLRVPQPLADASRWFACFDLIQVNQDEMDRMGPDPMAIAAAALGAGVRLLVVTLGPRGAVYFTRDRTPLASHRSPSAVGPIQTARVASPAVVSQAEADPTGCGDVFGATLFARLLAGADIEPALRDANGWAAKNAACRGATGLLHQLHGGIAVP